MRTVRAAAGRPEVPSEWAPERARGVKAIESLRRFFGLGRSRADQFAPPSDAEGSAPDGPPPDDAALDQADPAPELTDAPSEPRPDPVPCPYCSVLIDPPPRTRRCPSCHQQVIVRHVDGATVYLTASSAAVLEAERHREADVKLWTDARRHWITLAVSVHAPVDLCKKIAAMPISERAVEAARAVYRTASDQAVRDARETGHWVRVARIREIEADELYRDAGSPKPPPADILAVYRESRSAVLHSLAVHGTVAELAAGTCCAACRAEEGVLVKIAAELHKSRLPHAGCPRGLCGCDWSVAVPEAKGPRRRKRTVAKPAAETGTASGAEAERGAGTAEDAEDARDGAEAETPTIAETDSGAAEAETGAQYGTDEAGVRDQSADGLLAQVDPAAPAPLKAPARRARKPKTETEAAKGANLDA